VADNSSALRRARQRDGETKRHQADAALDAMARSGEPISFPAVARRAGVSVSLLYAHPDLAGRIATARARQSQAGRDRAWRLPARSLVTEASLRTDLANAKEQLRRLNEELQVLRGRLARDLGAGADLARGQAISPLIDQLEKRSEELEADNHTLRHKVVELENETRELRDTLEAARAMNRELISEINRPSPARGHRRPDPIPSPRPRPPRANPTL
jgi:flagellar biosynthesis chaperone FliJ